jgi:hypothetical protein
MCRARLRRGKPVDSPEVFKETDAVRARPGRLSALSVLHSKLVLYGGFVWARRLLNIQKRYFPPGQRASEISTVPFNSVYLGLGQQTPVSRGFKGKKEQLFFPGPITGLLPTPCIRPSTALDRAHETVRTAEHAEDSSAGQDIFPVKKVQYTAALGLVSTQPTPRLLAPPPPWG